jgi:hypothetical protein
VNGYLTNTGYNKNDRKFLFTEGGKYELQKEKLSVLYEFDTRQKDRIGKTVVYNISLNKNQLVADLNGKKETWNRIDEGKENLAGLWHITARKQDEKIVPIHQTGPRKTIKILSATRFQWAAINPETKEFLEQAEARILLIMENMLRILSSFPATAAGSALHFPLMVNWKTGIGIIVG